MCAGRAVRRSRRVRQAALAVQDKTRLQAACSPPDTIEPTFHAQTKVCCLRCWAPRPGLRSLPSPHASR